MGEIPRDRRRQLVEEQESELSIRRRCELLGVNRSTIYYQPQPMEPDDVELLNEIRDVWHRYPFYGYRRITKELQNQGIDVNRKRVQRLMKLGGVQAIFPGPNTSKRNHKHAVYPYLLRDIKITRPNQAWQTDITYLRLDKGFMYLVALIDIHSRYIVGWSLSNTLEPTFCVEALQQGFKIAMPEIVNSDQGSQFTSDSWIDALKELHIKISMTGKGRCIDNVYIERFWRSFKQEEFYLNDYSDVKQLKHAISAYVEFYNNKRWHQSLDYKTPAEVYFSEQGNPMDMLTSPSDRTAPCGTCGQAMDNASALPTT